MASEEAKDYIKNLTERFAAMTEEEKYAFLGIQKNGNYEGTPLDEALDKLADELGKDCPNPKCKCKKDKDPYAENEGEAGILE